MPANKGVGAGKYDNLYTAMHAAMRPQAAQGARDVTVRAVEQGARLLAAPPHGVRVVLQMPRGNLEGICPRVLVLAGIAAHLQARACVVPSSSVTCLYALDNAPVLSWQLLVCLQQIECLTVIDVSISNTHLTYRIAAVHKHSLA